MQTPRKDDERLANEQEWQRLRADFEAQASRYLDLKLSVYYVIRDQPTADTKFSEPNHAINLWQYFGHATPSDPLVEFETSELTRFGMTGAEVTAFAVIVGPETDLFRRMAERAGSLISDDITHRITVEVASRFFNDDPQGKPIYACNRNPLAKWLNLVLVAIATHQPDRFRTETLAVDPFTASLAAIDFLMGQCSTSATDPEPNPAIGHFPVALQQLAHEVRSLAMNLHCCNQDLAEEPSAKIMRRVHEQIQRIHALLPEPLSLADCDVLARRTLQELADWINAVEPQLKDASPPFQVPELGLIYGFASDLDRHADSEARRSSIAPPFTELQRQQIQQKYGATEYLRRRHAGEPDNAVERINAGMTDALHRFPEMRTWTVDEWSWLFFCSQDVVRQTAVWQSQQTCLAPLAAAAKPNSLTRILFLSANPAHLGRLRVDEEVREIEAKIRASDHRDSLQFITKWAARPDDLLQSLNEHKPQIVHFSGHGSPDQIALVDQGGNPKTVTTEALVSLFNTLKDGIRVVVLNACFSRSQAEAVAQHVGCAIGMNRSISDEAAIFFAASFYRAIGFGRSIKDAFDQGRTALLLEGISEHDTPELITGPGIEPDKIILVNA
ncbi:MAG: CHAT domain-containing protein [Pirellulales bacterium]|nr:CHAT domain-containing protein [Pirellulales bacterium]